MNNNKVKAKLNYGKCFSIKNNNIEAEVSNYGARIISLKVPDKAAKKIDVVNGFYDLQKYESNDTCYYGATIGRYANRIAEGKFNLSGKEFFLDINNNENHLHGGDKGFHTVLWDVVSCNENSIKFSHTSEDGDGGYPGTITVTVEYTLTNVNQLVIDFYATTDKQTIINLTNHSYFNLNGAGNINDHKLFINADYYLPISTTLIPTGEIATVKYTPFDFTSASLIGLRINDNNSQLINGRGYDHNFVLNKTNNGLVKAAAVEGDISKVLMEVFTTEPGLQLYTGNFMTGLHILNNGCRDSYRTAFCLETQHFPDSPNHSNFPSVILNPENDYTSQTIFKFSITE